MKVNEKLNKLLINDIATIPVWDNVSHTKVVLSFDCIRFASDIAEKIKASVLRSQVSVKIMRDSKTHKWIVVING
jgi:hypothetical protein